jgi:DNA-binding MarR family transcriptional regulator
MTRLLDRLEAKGFCRRQRSTDDRRVVRVELTPEGEVAAQEVPIVLAQVLNEHLAGFSKTEWSQLKDMLRRMVTNGEAAETGKSE